MATLSLAFIGTVGLAKLVVDERAKDSPVVSGQQSPPDWPIAFTLPRDHRWRHDPRQSIQTEGESSAGDSVAFMGQRLSGGHGILWVSVQRVSPGTQPEELAREMFEEDLGASEEIEMGPIEGRMAESRSASNGASVVAFGCTPEGLVVVVVYATRSRNGDEAGVVRSVCKSIVFTE